MGGPASISRRGWPKHLKKELFSTYDLMLVSDYLEVSMKDPVRVCCVCKKSNLDGEWLHNSIDELIAARPDLTSGEEIHFSHGYCSAKCISEGSGLSIKDAIEIYQSLLDK